VKATFSEVPTNAGERGHTDWGVLGIRFDSLPRYKRPKNAHGMSSLHRM
jgi:hypothetical protein